MLKRLFIKLPLYLLWFISLITIIIPIGYWIITDKDYGLDQLQKISDL